MSVNQIENPKEAFSLSLQFVMNDPPQEAISPDIHKNLKELFVAYLKQTQRLENVHEELTDVVANQSSNEQSDPNKIGQFSTLELIDKLAYSLSDSNKKMLEQSTIIDSDETDKLVSQISNLTQEKNKNERMLQEVEIRNMQTVQELQQEKEEHQKLKKRYKEEVENSQVSIAKFKTLYYDTLSSLKDSERLCSKIPKMESEISSLKTQNTSSFQESEFYQTNNNDLKEQNNDLNRKVKELGDKLKSLRFRSSIMQAQLENMKGQKSEEFKHFTLQIEDLEKNNIELLSENVELRSQFNNNLSMSNLDNMKANIESDGLQYLDEAEFENEIDMRTDVPETPYCFNLVPPLSIQDSKDGSNGSQGIKTPITEKTEGSKFGIKNTSDRNIQGQGVGAKQSGVESTLNEESNQNERLPVQQEIKEMNENSFDNSQQLKASKDVIDRRNTERINGGVQSGLSNFMLVKELRMEKRKNMNLDSENKKLEIRVCNLEESIAKNHHLLYDDLQKKYDSLMDTHFRHIQSSSQQMNLLYEENEKLRKQIKGL